jgi:hypothetical protein
LVLRKPKNLSQNQPWIADSSLQALSWNPWVFFENFQNPNPNRTHDYFIKFLNST